MPSIPRVTAVLLGVNIVAFLLQQVAAEPALAYFALWPLGPHHLERLSNGSVVSVGFEIWQLVTYSFLHGGISHIAFNMLALWMFGGPVENALGARRYTLYYFACVLGAAFAQLATVAMLNTGDDTPTLGASGGVFGLLLAFAYLYPQAKVFLFFIPVPVPARLAVIGYLVLELFFGVTGRQADVAHFAHLGGALIGFLLILFWRARQRQF